MLKKIYSMMTTNIIWKLLSFSVATALWFIVMNVNNPVDTRIYPLKLQIANMDAIADNQYILQNEEALATKVISVKVKASVKALSELSANIRNFRAYIDLRPIDISRTEELGKPMDVTVKYDLPAHLNAAAYEITSVDPSTTEIILDKYVEKEFTVQVVKSKDVKADYVSMQAVAKPGVVTVKGAQSTLDTIDRIEAGVNLSAATHDVETTEKLTIFDKNDRDITNLVELDVSSVRVSVPVDRYAKIPISAPTFSGNVAEGNRFESATWTPEVVEVVGAEADINAMQPIQLPTINIDNENATFEKRIDLRQFFMDSNLTIRNGTPHDVVVTVHIEKEAIKTLTFPIDALNIEGMDKPFVLPEGNITLSFKGLEDAVNALTTENVSPYIDLSGLDVGRHEVPVMVVLPDDIIPVNAKPTVMVEVLEETPSSSPEVTP